MENNESDAERITTASYGPKSGDPQATERSPISPPSWAEAIVEYSDDAITSYSLDGTVLSWNTSAARLFGYSAAEMVGAPITRLCAADRLQEHDALHAHLLTGKAISNVETQRIRKDGSVVNISATFSPLRDAGGSIVATSTIARDLSVGKHPHAQRSDIAERDSGDSTVKGSAVAEDWTARKTADEALLASESFLERAGAVAGVGGFRINLLTGEHSWTRQTFRIHGLEGPVAPPLAELDRMFDADVRTTLQQALATAIESGQGYDIEAPMVTADGRAIWVRVLGEVEYCNGQAAFVSGAIQDITDRKTAEQALRSSQEFLDRAGRIAGVGAWSYDLRTGKIYWSSETCRIHGRDLGHQPTLEEALSHYPGPSRATIERAVEACITNGTPFDFELEFASLDGTRKWVRAVGESESKDGQSIRLFGAFQDITARKRDAAHLLEQHELLRVTLDSIGEAVITTDSQGTVQWLNPVAGLLTGWSSSEGRGRPSTQIFNVVDRQTRLPIDNPATLALLENRSVVSMADTILIARTGEEVGIEVSASPIRAKEGPNLGTVLVFHDVSERQRAAEALRSANERLGMATEAACIGIWDFDVPANSVRCDSEMCRIYGLPAGSLDTFEHWAITLHPEDSEATQRAVASALNAETDYDTEFRIIRPDGEIRYVKAAGKVRRDSSGAPLLMVGINVDITERKRAEAAVAESSSHVRALYKVTSAIIDQHQLDALLQTLVEAVAEALPADRVTLITFDLNERTVTHFAKGGPGSEFVVQVPFEELSHGLSGWVLRTGLPALSSKNAPDPREEPDVQKRRTETHCGDILVVPVGYKGHIIGTLTAINGTAGAEFEEKHVALMTATAGHVAVAISNISLFRELTDNARELHATTERLTLATDAACMGIWEWDQVANTFRWDDRMYEIYHRLRSGDVEPYAVWANTLHEEDRQRAEQELQSAFDGERDLDTTYRIVQPDGTVRHIKAAARVQRHATGAPLRLVGVTFDTTERNEAVARAQAANLAKSQFLANMSHEIRTPLNAIIGLGYLLEQTMLSEEQRAFVAKVQFAGRSLLSVVNNVLDLSKIEAGEMILEEEGFDVVSLAEQVGQMLAPQAQTKGVHLGVAPSTDLPRFLRGDAARLRQILTNLLNNAIKFTEHGHVNLAVSCVERTDASLRLRCSVKDSGIGIAPAGIARLFTPFVQADASTTRRFGGTGLGLSIARRFVELMGGEIGVNSELNVGSEFWVEVPLRIVLESDVDYPGQSTRPLHVLVLEASAAPVALESVIRPLGWLPHTVRHAEEVVARLRVRSVGAWPDVIVIDCAQNHVDLHELASRLRTEFAQMELPPMIVIDNEPQSDGQYENLKPMVSVVLRRPVGSSTLFNAVNTALATRYGDHHNALQGTGLDHGVAQWLSGARILVADDSEVNRVVARTILAKQGATVALCSNGLEAVERLRAEPEAFDVVLMDVQMPELDGNEATQRIRGDLNLKTLPIIALTAGALVSERERAFAAGMDDFLCKPLEPAALIRVVRRFVEQKRGAPLPVAFVDGDTNSTSMAIGLAPVDAKLVKQRFGNDVELFSTLVTRVLREFAEFALPVSVVSDYTVRKECASKLHKLRGSAGVIGAKAVQRLAAAGERALEEEQPAELIESILRQLAAAFTAFGEEVRPLIEAAAAKDAPKGDHLPPTASAPEMMITELLDLLDNQNLGAIEHLKTLAPALNATFGATQFALLRHAVEELEFFRAASLLRAGLQGAASVARSSG